MSLSFFRRCRLLFLAACFSFGVCLPASSPLYAERPRRLVTLIPSHTEIVTALGLESRLVGVSEVERARDFPLVSRVGGLTPNWEVLVALAPDMILADVSHKRYEDEFARFRLPVVYLPATKAGDMEDVFSLILEVGRLLDCAPKAETLVRGCQARLAAAEARVPKGTGPRVFFEIWPEPLRASGPQTLQGALLRRAGAVNIVPKTKSDMPLLSLEWVPRAAPEVILHTGVVSTEEMRSRPGWSRIPAFRFNRVYVVDRDLFSRAGPRIVEAFEQLVALLYSPVTPAVSQ